MILDVFLSKFNEFLMQMVQDEVGMLLGIPSQIEKLGETVRDIQCVLADAERKQSKGSAIERWLMQLKDIMYDADDVIDLCQLKAKHHFAASTSSSSSNAHCGFPLLSCFRNPFMAHEIGYKIKDIHMRLEGLAKKKYYLGLTESQICLGHSPRVRRVESISRKTDPLVVLDDIVGEKIEEDTELLVNWLIEEEKGMRENVCVAAIVGMGGIGKTTLAKRIFSDTRIQEEFQLKIWVCISKDVIEVELLKCVIREAGGEHGDAQERSELVPLLKRLVQGKKFLLVLDDVWDESRVVWDNLLRTPMMDGAHRSKLLITTRDERVANGMRATKINRVEKLSDKDSLSLLIKQVLPNGIESEIQDLLELGMQIVKKCDGLPLAIKSIGGVLCTKGNTRSNWQAVLRSNVWSMNGLPRDVHHAFYLSYEDLPPSLKQCFIFCSLFHKDYVFFKSKLIYLWLAEGFLPDNGDFWELGNEYYTELLLRNLLEVTGPSYNQVKCKMHDILWSFARQLGKYDHCILWNGQHSSRSESSLQVRRLSIEGNEINIKVIKKEKGLRTLLVHYKPEIAPDDLCKVFSNLRVLDLSCSNFSCLSNSLCDLVHLRYLDVGGSTIRNLPNSIGNLKYLVYLNFANCKQLSHIPPSIINLKELKYINTYNSGIEAIPTGLNKLDNLVELYGFKPDNNSLEGFSSLDSIETLSQLIVLHLFSLDKVLDKNIAKRANLQNKDRLQDLKLIYKSLSWKDQASQTNEKKVISEGVLNELCPPRSVEIVTIEGYFGKCLPNWLNLGAALPNLRYLCIENSACFEELAPLGQLPNLDLLRIKGAYSIVSIGQEFMYGDTKNKDQTAHVISCFAILAFPKLNTLSFEGMLNWKEWQWNKGQTAMPKLKELYIDACPQLSSLPQGLLHHATSLEYLQIYGVDKLSTVENLPSIKDIRVSRNPILERISNLPSISYILIKECSNLKAVENLKGIQTMALIDHEMKILSDYLTTTMPKKLRIWCSEELLVKIACQRESGSEWNKFKHIPKVTIYSLDESFYATYQKTPFSFTTNVTTSSYHR
ncbi:putative disease resistance protein RGA3 [Carex rostrata]